MGREGTALLHPQVYVSEFGCSSTGATGFQPAVRYQLYAYAAQSAHYCLRFVRCASNRILSLQLPLTTVVATPCLAVGIVHPIAVRYLRQKGPPTDRASQRPMYWATTCAREDSNLHVLNGHQGLNLACLPFHHQRGWEAFMCHGFQPSNGPNHHAVRSRRFLHRELVSYWHFPMRQRGFEPPLSKENQPLKLACLPFHHCREV